MANLKLPDIEPARSFKGAEAAAIEQAGSQFDSGMQALAKIPYELDKQRLISESAKAADTLTETLANVKMLPKAEPVVSPDRVKELFGGEVPPQIRLTETKTLADGSSVEQNRASIPTHEIYPHLFDRAVKVGLANAKAKISVPGWQSKFEQAAQPDIQRARADAYDFAIAQHREEIHAQGVARADYLAKSGQFGMLEAFLKTPEAGLSVGERETGLASIPEQKTVWNLTQHLQNDDLAGLVKAREDVQANRLRDPSKPGDGSPLEAPLSPQEKTAWTAHIDHKIAALQKAGYDARHAAFAEPLIQARNLPPAQRKTAMLQNPWVLPLGHGLTPEDATSLQNLHDKLLNGEDVKDDIPRFAELAQNDWARLRGMSLPEVQMETSRFSDTTGKELLRVWGDIQAGKKPVSLSQDEESDLHLVLKKLGFKGDKDASDDEHLRYRAAYEQLKHDYYFGRRDPKQPAIDTMMSLGAAYVRNAPKSNIGDTGYTDIDPEVLLVTRQVLAFQGQPVSAANIRREALALDKAMPTLKDAWKSENPDSEVDTTALAQVYNKVRLRRASVVDDYNAARRTNFRDAGVAARSATPPTNEELYRFVISTQYSTPENRAAAETGRAETQKRADNKVANTEAQQQSAAALQERLRLYNLYLKQFKVTGPPSARSDIPTFDQWLVLRGRK